MAVPDWLSATLDLRWPAWLTAGLLMAIGGWLCFWALFGDRARGRRRCPKCWYDLRGTPGLRCSECGHAARGERQLWRSRRHWLTAALGGLILAIALAVGVGPSVKQYGWYSLLPNWALLRLAPPAGVEMQIRLTSPLGAAQSPLLTEIDRRDLADLLSPRQWQYVVENKEIVRTRNAWPIEVPLAVCMRMPLWLGRCTVELSPDFASHQRASAGDLSWGDCGLAVMGRKASEACQVVGPIGALADSVSFHCTVTQVPGGWKSPSWEENALMRWQGKVRLPVRIVESIGEAIEPLSGTEIDTAVRKHLHVRVVVQPPSARDSEYIEVSANLRRDENAVLRDVAFGFRVELIRDGAVRETILLAPDPDAYGLTSPRPSTSAYVKSFSTPELADSSLDNRWSIHVSGDPILALCDWDMPKYWAGEFSVPLAEVIERR